jgi:hypothetical protein
MEHIMSNETHDSTVRPLGKILELFHTQQQDAYATVAVNGHRETWAQQTKEFRRLREQYYYALTGTMPSLGVLKEELRTLEARARFEGPELPVSLRIAALEDTIYLDLTNPAWEVVEITAAGWCVTEDPWLSFAARHTCWLYHIRFMEGASRSCVRLSTLVPRTTGGYWCRFWSAPSIRGVPTLSSSSVDPTGLPNRP